VVFSHTCNTPIAITAATAHFRFCNPGRDHDLFLEHVATVSDFLTVVFSHTCNSPIAITADTVHFRFCNSGRDHGQKITDRGYVLQWDRESGTSRYFLFVREHGSRLDLTF
jgi:hypothetical protein